MDPYTQQVVWRDLLSHPLPRTDKHDIFPTIASHEVIATDGVLQCLGASGFYAVMKFDDHRIGQRKPRPAWG